MISQPFAYFLVRLFPGMLCDFLGWSNPHLGRFEGFKATSHGSLEDLLYLIFTLVDGEVAPAVPVAVLRTET